MLLIVILIWTLDGIIISILALRHKNPRGITNLVTIEKKDNKNWNKIKITKKKRKYIFLIKNNNGI